MILILDFGSQYTQLIARRVREMNVYSIIKPCTVNLKEVDLAEVTGIILSGGPSSVMDSDAPAFDPQWLEQDKPVLGVCYGMQLMAHLSGGKLARGAAREYGQCQLSVKGGKLFRGITSRDLTVWMSHGDHVEEPPEGFTVTASSTSLPVAAMDHKTKPWVAIQFHPEVVHTQEGKTILKNFVFDIAGEKGDWSPGNVIDRTVSEIRSLVGDSDQAVCALSGGVDSTVAAVLVSKALGKRLHCVFVDNGLLRLNEAKQVMERLAPVGLNLQLVDASERFLGALHGVTDPEKKRKIIGHEFIEVFANVAKTIPAAKYLVQGTLYPDVIESVSVRGPSATIKSHHNVGGLPEKLSFKLIEPLRELFKDEVRALGKTLEVPAEILARQPFPGPGLAVRVLGPLTEERLDVARKADAIFVEEIRAAGYYGKLWQSFAVLLPVSSVGVMGDGRTYEETIALRAVRSEDGMTADWCFLPEELLRRASSRIVNEVRGVNRVVLDISNKPPATIEWE